jgi:hypothetical protein
MIVKALRGGMQSISKSKSRSRSVFTASLVVIHLKRHQHYRSTAMRNTQVCHSCGAIERRGNDTLVTTTNLLFLPAAHRSRFLTADDKYLLPPQHSPTTRIYFHPHSFVPSHPQQTTQTTWMKFPTLQTGIVTLLSISVSAENCNPGVYYCYNYLLENKDTSPLSNNPLIQPSPESSNTLTYKSRLHLRHPRD